MRKYTIIIPVYNALEHVKACLLSVLRNTSMIAWDGSNETTFQVVTILVIDDASTDAEVLRYLDSLPGKEMSVCQIRHVKNLGFVRTANEGIREAFTRGSEPILLNSDTVVPPRWLERLDNARNEAEGRGVKVASVHPLSNCASFYSVPNPFDNAMPEGLTVEEMDALVYETSLWKYPVVPCAVGFCMMLTREAVEAVGLFDTKWGKGYGEETEWSIKAAAAGFGCVLADDVFVKHDHHASFGRKAKELRKEHQQRFLDEYPHFTEVVKAWFIDSPQVEHRIRLANRLRPRHHGTEPLKVVYVCHHWGKLGGLEIFQQRLVEELKESVEITVLHPTRGDLPCDSTTFFDGSVLHVVMSPRMVQQQIDLGIFPFEFNADHVEKWFAKVIETLAPDVVHFQHLGGWGTFRLPEIASSFAKTVLSVHDDFYLCPSYLTAGWSCGRDAAANCEQCRECVNEEMTVRVEGRHTEQLGSMLGQRQREIEFMFQNVNTVIFPSDVICSRYQASGPVWYSQNVLMIPHGVPRYRSVKLPKKREKFVIAWIGGVLNEKGWPAFAGLCKILMDDERFEFVVLGEWHEQADRSGLDHVKFLRRYAPEDLPQLLQRFDIVVPAIARKEAYGLVVDECMAAGACVVLADVPTIRERAPHANYYQWGESTSLKDAVERAIVSPFYVTSNMRTMTDCAADYLNLYGSL